MRVKLFIMLGSMLIACNQVRTSDGVKRKGPSTAEPVSVPAPAKTEKKAGNETVEGKQPEVKPDIPQAFVEKHGLLRAVSGKLVNKNNEPIQLRGMSLFWSQYAPQFWNKSVVSTLRTQWKATLIRAAMGVEDGGYLTNRQVEKDRVKLIVDEAIKQDMYVIIDWHDHNAASHPSDAVDFFREMAQTYANVPNVMFEIYNEPDDETWLQVKAYSESVIQAIRQTGAKNLVIVGSPTWSQSVDQAANLPIDDSNIAYTLHFYAATHRQELRDKASYAISRGLTLFVTEFGLCEASGNGVIDLDETNRWLDFLNTHKISWANWSLNDKAEAASALRPGASAQGAWTAADLTDSGRYIKGKIAE